MGSRPADGAKRLNISDVQANLHLIQGVPKIETATSIGTPLTLHGKMLCVKQNMYLLSAVRHLSDESSSTCSVEPCEAHAKNSNQLGKASQTMLHHHSPKQTVVLITGRVEVAHDMKHCMDRQGG